MLALDNYDKINLNLEDIELVNMTVYFYLAITMKEDVGLY
jgi:hypothetical protein